MDQDTATMAATTPPDTAGWVIMRDLIDPDDPCVGYGQVQGNADDTQASFEAVIGRTVYVSTELSSDLVRDSVAFRLRDDDGEVYYEGRIRRDWLDDDRAFLPLAWAEANAGCTIMEFRNGRRWDIL
jgi:hypothetical protein